MIPVLELWLDQTIRIAFSLVYHIYFICLGIAEYKEIMSDQFHLNTSFFRIHRFHRKFFGTNNGNLFLIVDILINKSLAQLRYVLLFLNQLILIFAKLAFDDFFYQHKGAEPEIQHDDEPNAECGTGAVDAEAAAALTKPLSDSSMAALIKNLAKSL